MNGERRKSERHPCDDTVALRPTGPAGAQRHVVDIYLRERGQGGMSGSCFSEHPLRVNDLYAMADSRQGSLKLRVVWSQRAAGRGCSAGFQFVRGPVAT